MNISGESFKDGINFFGEKSYVIAKINKEGNQVVKLVHYKNSKNILSDIPVLKYYINSNKTIIKSLISLFVCIVIDSIKKGIIKTNINTSAIFYITFGGLIYIICYSKFCRNFFGFHGAEHKAINSYNLYKDVSLENMNKSSRIARNCSTNFQLLYLLNMVLVVIIFRKFYFTLLFINYGISRELFMLKDIDKCPLFSIVFKLGAFLQNMLLTKEPTDEQIILAHNAISKLIDAECID